MSRPVDDEPIEVRDHLSQRNGRRRIELEARRGFRPLMTVIAGLGVALAIGVYMAIHISSTLFTGSTPMAFVVGDATGVVKGVDEVRFKGIPIGRVIDIKTENDQAVVTARVESKYGHMYRDARAQLRPNTALQDMYLDITDRGTKGAGVLEGSTPLAAGRTEVPVSIDDVLDVFQAPVRVRLQTLLDQLGNGLDDRGARLRTAFAEAVPFVTRLGAVSHQLAVRAPMVRRLVHNTGVLTTALGERQTQLNTLVRSGSATLTELKDDRGNLGRTLDALPPTLDTLNSSFVAVDHVLPDVDTAVRSLQPVANHLPVSLDAVDRLNASAAPAVHALQPPVRRLVPLTASLKPLSAKLATAVDALAPQVHTLDKVTSDLVACRKGVVGFFQWNASISKLGDSRAPFPRGNLVAGAQSSGVANDPSEFYPRLLRPRTSDRRTAREAE